MRNQSTYLLLCAFVLGSGLSACSNEIEPLADDAGSYVFLNGFLDTAADSQFVRLDGLRSNILGDPRDISDAVVSTLDRGTGERVFWTDSLVTLSDGNQGTIYFAPLRPVEGHIYDFQVDRPGFETAGASTHVPSLPGMFTSVLTGPVGFKSQELTLVGVNQAPKQIRLQYDIIVPETGEELTRVFDYGQGGRVSGQSWIFQAFLTRDMEVIDFSLGRESASTPLGLKQVSAQITIESREWGKASSPENLTRALGFFASVGRFSIPWVLSPLEVQAVGFTDEQAR